MQDLVPADIRWKRCSCTLLCTVLSNTINIISLEGETNTINIISLEGETETTFVMYIQQGVKIVFVML